MKASPRWLLIPALVLTFSASGLYAATVSWSSAATISGNSDVSTDGTLAFAYYFTNVAEPPPAQVTVNGVTFERFHSSTPNVESPLSLGSGNLTATGSSGSLWIAPSDSSSNPFASLSADYRNLLAGQLYDYGHYSGFDDQTLTLQVGNLIFGQAYQVQFWSNESRAVASTETRTGRITSGTQSVEIDYNMTNSEGGVGQFVTATFTADGTSQTFEVTGVNGALKVPLINAIQMRAIPEPATALLVLPAFAAVLFAAGRRKP